MVWGSTTAAGKEVGVGSTRSRTRQTRAGIKGGHYRIERDKGVQETGQGRTANRAAMSKWVWLWAVRLGGTCLDAKLA